MKPNWTKADCKRLREGNPAKLRKWIRDYADSLFTWLMVHYPLSQDQAAERTLRIFQNAYPRLNEYDPAGSTMYLWLIQRAQSLYPKETPPTFEVPPPFLRALGLIGSQEIPASLPEHPAVIQLIQAALTEMDESERTVLLRRYHRIDRKASAELDPQSSSDSLGDHLVRSRYYFRRHLLAWIHSLQPDIGEFSPDSRINLFENNLEKIFCSISPALKLPQGTADEIETALLQQAEQFLAQAKPAESMLMRKSVWIAGVLVLLGAVWILSFLLRDQSPAEPAVSSVPVKSGEKAQPSSPEAAKQNLSPEELKRYMNRIFEAGSLGDIQELLRALEEGPYPAQVAAAVFLGRIGDESAIGPLEKAARRWHPDPKDENPFLTAINQIEQRLILQARQQEEEALAQQREALEAQQVPEPETEVVTLPAEPNQPTLAQEEPPIPAVETEVPLDLQEQEAVEETDIPQQQEEEWEQEEIPADQQEEYPSETEEPNEIETEESEEEYPTEDVQYIDEQSAPVEY